METTTLKFVNINYEKGVVHLEWTTAPTSDELILGLYSRLELVKEKKATKWIGDVQKMGAINPSDQDWINQVWFPEFLQTGVKKMGIIVGNDIFNQLSVESIMSNVESIGFTSQYFPNTKEAQDWIQQ